MDWETRQRIESLILKHHEGGWDSRHPARGH
jgi:hypothetical protein